MEWNLDDGRPIWPQIKERLMAEIAAGRFPMGSAFPTVRELAEDAKVNRNTMQRALAELESEGLVITNRTAGRTVTTDRDLVAFIRAKIAREKVVGLLAEMQTLGYGPADVLQIITGMQGGAGDDKRAQRTATDGSTNANTDEGPESTSAAADGSTNANTDERAAQTPNGSSEAVADKREKRDKEDR